LGRIWPAVHMAASMNPPGPFLHSSRARHLHGATEGPRPAPARSRTFHSVRRRCSKARPSCRIRSQMTLPVQSPTRASLAQRRGCSSRCGSMKTQTGRAILSSSRCSLNTMGRLLPRPGRGRGATRGARARLTNVAAGMRFKDCECFAFASIHLLAAELHALARPRRTRPRGCSTPQAEGASTQPRRRWASTWN
jgi:hypothetical protein